MPFYKYHIFTCINERPDGHERGCCSSKNSLALTNYLKARVKEEGLEGIRVNKAGCLDRCELGPVLVVYPDEVWYRPTSIEDMETILQEHLKKGETVKKLQLQDTDS